MKSQIDFSDFQKLDLRVGEIISAAEVPGSAKLLELKVNFGPEVGERTIYAGIKAFYEPGTLAGRKLVFVVNLAPKTFKIGDREYTSFGMLLAADPGGKAVLYSFDEELPAGTILR